MARGLNERGVSVAVTGYDLCPHVSIADIIEQIRHACIFLWLRTGQRMMVFGHSAGGHLAGAMVATDWPTLYPRAGDLVPAACSISGLFDLTPLVGISMNQDLRLDDASARAASPLFWPAPTGRTFDAVVGGDDRASSCGRAACWPMPGARPACTRATRRSARPIISP